MKKIKEEDICIDTSKLSDTQSYLVCIGIRMYKSGMSQAQVINNLKKIKETSDDNIKKEYYHWMGIGYET